MTSITDREPILYPHTEGGWPLCSGCFRQRGDVAHAIDPRTGFLDLLCGDCYRALAAGYPQPLPTGDELERVWRRLARLHQNREISDDVIDIALAVLTPGYIMPPHVGWQRFEVLKHELLELQAAENGEVDLNTLDPQWRDAETYTNHLAGLVDDAVHKLIGARR